MTATLFDKAECPWEPVSESLADLRKASASGPPERKFTILGAGMAGLAAGFELSSCGHEVRILEGSRRVGGRVHTHRFDNGQIGEFGAMRIPQAHDYTWHYVHQFGLAVRPFFNDNDRAYFDVRGCRARIGAFVDEILPLFVDGLTGEERAVLEAPPPEGGPGGLLRKHLEPLMDRLGYDDRRRLLDGDLADSALRDLDAVALRGWMWCEKLSDAGRAVLDATLTMDSWGQWSLAEIIRDELHKPPLSKERHQLWEIEGGLQRLPEALAGELEGCIELGWEIEEIHVGPGGTRIRGRRSDGCFEETSVGPVLCTLPFPVLRQLRITGLGPEKARAIRRMSYASSTKVLVACDKRVWELENQPIVGGRSVTDRMARQVYYPSDNVLWDCTPGFAAADVPRWTFLSPEPRGWGQPVPRDPAVSEGPGVLLASYTWNNDARSFGNRSVEAALDVVLADLECLHPGIERHVVDCAMMAWDRSPWSRGAFAITPPGDLRDHAMAARTPEGRLFFAGEHLSIAPGWIQGAIQSALLAARGMLRCRPLRGPQ